MAKSRSTLRRILLVIVAVPAALLVLYLLAFGAFFIVGPFAEDYSKRTTFDAKSWRERALDQEYPEWPTRLRMVDDLIATRRLDSVTRDQLLALLGPADETDHFRNWNLVYWLGPERNGFVRIDSEWLVIRFDAESRVASYRLVRD